ncbi:hypothetical protein DMC30DRAFT_44681 [Rhodotorula diobovata]|uniref:Uncharacterized protein n=1 Tax=Rhodotorula diobovata TaxID=5288 RepID=A0A5C5G2A6_9BASI|nr:hypothetical protein DMC30DRAFT_44681 [Rhodotorula diobovata]
MAALVSTSPPPSTSLYPAAAPVLARGPVDPSTRSLASPHAPSAPSPPSASNAPSMTAQHGPPGAAAVGASPGWSAKVGAQGGSTAARGEGGGGGAPAVRSIPGPQAPGARTGSAPAYADANAPSTATGAFAVADGAPAALAPARSLSTPPAPASSASSRPSPSPTSGTARGSSSSSSLRSASHAPSASTSSAASFAASSAGTTLPRLAPVQYGGGGSSPSLTHSPQMYLPPGGQQQQHHPMAVTAHPTHPTFAGQAFPPFAPAYPHPAYPFIPSPHPGNPANGLQMNGYAFNGANAMQLSAEQQKRMQQYQHQWQLELLKGQQQMQGDGRRRTSSGPAASSSPSYYTTPSNYPPSPSPTLHQHQQQQQIPFGMTGPSLPPGAMLPHVGAHGYPTPPGSTEGANRSGGESGSSNSSSGAGRAEAYHPYRRDDRRGGDGRSAPSSVSQHRSAPSSASSHGGGAGRRSLSNHGRQDSSASIAQLAQQNYPHPHALPPPIRNGSSTSVHSVGHHGGSGGSSPSGSVRHVPLPSTSSASSSSSSIHRQRTDSQNSSNSSSLQHARQDSSSSASSFGPNGARPSSALRGPSFDSARSATPVQARGRPSPLGAPTHAAEESEDDDGAESDGTAEATATISTGLVAAAPAAPVPAHVAPAVKGKDKDKKGMKSRFKKAFGVSNSASSSTLTEADFDGRDPKVVNGRLRRDSSGSSGDDEPRQQRPYATHQPQQASLASSSASIMTNTDGLSTMTGATGTTASGKKPPSSRFRMLNSKFNGSSDNLSISSTVSSASVMIRKLGQMGKLASRNSLMGLTKAFKKGAKDGDDAATIDGVLITPSSSANKLAKKDRKKAGASSASVSHATAEFESPSKATPSGMSPAAALARKQQQAYAEQEAAEQQRARDAAAAEAARLGPPQRSFEQVPAHARSDSATSDVASVRSGKERKKWRLGFGGGGSKTDLHETASLNDDRASVMTAGTERGGAFAQQYDDATPRQSLEVLAPPQAGYQTYGAGHRHERSESSEYEPSLYREGATPKGALGRPVRGILKGAGSYRQDDFATPRPPFARNRASSFDSPQQHGRPGSPGGPGAALVNVIPSEQQVDGVGPLATSPRTDTHPPTSSELMHDAVAARIHPESATSGPYAHAELNASAPALNHFSSLSSMRPSPPATAKGRRIVFASNLSVHTTWPAAIYDRRAEPATCNRLTPVLAQQIKEELNSFKMEEMDVHPASRKLTHFFV